MGEKEPFDYVRLTPHGVRTCLAGRDGPAAPGAPKKLAATVGSPKPGAPSWMMGSACPTETPILACRLAELFTEAGLPDGVRNIVLAPVIRDSHKRRTIKYIETGREEGADLLLDGRLLEATGGEGCCIGPTIFDHAKPGMTIRNDEMIAPVQLIVRVDSLQEAIEAGNKYDFARIENGR